MSFSFDLNNVSSVSSGVIPAGTYRVQVESSELKDTKAGTGKYIECQFVVVDENQNGRKFWELFNIINPNQKAVDIGLSRIKQLIEASGGEPGLFNSEEVLIGLECLVTLKVVVDSYGEKNKVVAFKMLPADLPKEANDLNDIPF